MFQLLNAKTEKVPETINTTFSDAYTYQCKPGYGSCDSMTTQCTADGSWSLPPPQCKSELIQCLIYHYTHMMYTCVCMCVSVFVRVRVRCAVCAVCCMLYVT